MEKMLKDKKFLIIVAALVLLLIVCVVVFGNSTKNDTKKKSENSKPEISDRRIIKDTSADRILEERNTEKYNISNIYINKGEKKEAILVADFKNITGKNLPETDAYIVVLGAENKELGKVEIKIKKLKADAIYTVKADISEYYENALDFDLELKK